MSGLIGTILPATGGGIQPIASVAAAVELLKGLNWKCQEVPGYKDASRSGHLGYAVLGGNPKTGDILVMAVIENAAAPKHRHREGAHYGERIWTLTGALHDVADNGTPVILTPESGLLVHGPGTIHQPWAEWWIGWYHQPRGSEILL